MVTDEQRIIQDVLRASYRSSPLLFDSLGIMIDREKAKELYCINYNKTLLVDMNRPSYDMLVRRSVDQHITPDTMSSEQEKMAVIEMAHLIAESWK